MKFGIIKKIGGRTVVTAAFFMCAFVCVAFDNAIPVDSYAARVNDGVITVGQVMVALAPLEAQLRQAYSGAELHKQLDKAYEKILDSMIERRLIVAEFKRQGMSIPDTVVDGRIDELVHNQFKRDKLALLDQLGVEGLTVQEWRREIRDQIVVSIMREREIESKIFISPRQIRERYEQNSDRYRTPAEVEMRMIVFEIAGADAEEKEAKRLLVESVRKKLVQGADFGEMAREVSSGIKAQDGGYWGWVAPRSRREELAVVLEKLSPREVSEVIEVDDRLYVLTVDSKKSAMVIPFHDAEADIIEELRMEAAQRLYDELIERLRKRVYVRKFN